MSICSSVDLFAHVNGYVPCRNVSWNSVSCLFFFWIAWWFMLGFNEFSTDSLPWNTGLYCGSRICTRWSKKVTCCWWCCNEESRWEGSKSSINTKPFHIWNLTLLVFHEQWSYGLQGTKGCRLYIRIVAYVFWKSTECWCSNFDQELLFYWTGEISSFTYTCWEANGKRSLHRI